MTVEFGSAFEQAFTAFVNERYAEECTLNTAIRYVLLGTGKRVRARLVDLTAGLFDGSQASAIRAGYAVEMIHAYSLVHDDLPCLDDDALRRGRATAHVKFGEDFALLTGDALLTDAFLVLVEPKLDAWAPWSAQVKASLVHELSTAAGSLGMVGGQAMDVYWTAKKGAKRNDLDDIHRRKTGYLIGAACAFGAISAGAGAAETSTLRRFGEKLGHAYQIVDDLIDENAEIGKSRGKDREDGKLTYLSMMSYEDAKTAAQRQTEDALDELSCFNNAEDLKEFARILLLRRS